MIISLHAEKAFDKIQPPFIRMYYNKIYVASLIAQLVKNPPAMQETPVQLLGWEDPLEKG